MSPRSISESAVFWAFSKPNEEEEDKSDLNKADDFMRNKK